MARPRIILRLYSKLTAVAVTASLSGVSTWAGVSVPALQGNDTTAGDMFGYSVSVHDGVGVVGARLHDTDAGSHAGSAYLFDTATNTQLRKLMPDDAEPGDFFGRSVALHGNNVAVGAAMNDDAGNNSGAAYLFNATTGRERFKLTADDAAASDQFGHAVGISGSTAVVSAPWEDQRGTNAGAVYVFDAGNGLQQRKLTAPDAQAGDRFGYSLAVDGNLVLIGAQSDDAGIDSGSAYLYDTTTGTQLRKFTASDAAAGDMFGSVAISNGLALIGAPRSDTNAQDAGVAYLYDVATGQELRKLTASDPTADARFGFSVAIDNGIALIGAYGDKDNTGAVYGFEIFTGNELFKFTPDESQPGDSFGFSLSLSGLTALVGAPLVSTPGGNAGAAYLLELPPPSPPIIGDLNRDGFVGVDDLNFLLLHWNEYAGFQQPQLGDITGDGYVGLDDLSFMLANWNQGIPPTTIATIPEPMSWMVIVWLSPGLLFRVEPSSIVDHG